MKAFLEVGEFVTTHGILGELKLYPWCDEPEFLLQFSTLYLDDGGKKNLRVKQVRIHKNMCLIQLEGVDSIEAARAYIGKTAYISRGDVVLEEGAVFVQDLLGASVVNADTGVVYGQIANVLHPGRHDVYEVKTADGTIHFFPAVEEFLVEVNVQERFVKVRPIAGMFENEMQEPAATTDAAHTKSKKKRSDEQEESV